MKHEITILLATQIIKCVINQPYGRIMYITKLNLIFLKHKQFNTNNLNIIYAFGLLVTTKI